MIQYHRRLQSIQESDAEYTDIHGHQRKGSGLGSQYNGEDSINGRVLNSINLNTILQQQNNSSQKSYDQSQLVSKYLQLSKNSQQQHSQQKTVMSTNDDVITAQNGQQTKPFFDENSIDLSFINFLNKDDGQNVSYPTHKQILTSKNQLPMNPSFVSNVQANSMLNLNTSSNQTKVPSVQTSQLAQEKYQIGVQNINDLANLLISNNHTPDRVIQNKKQENDNQQKKAINLQYDEIMAKYSSVLQKSYEMPNDADSPNNQMNDSVKVTEFPYQNALLQDNLIQPQIQESLKKQVINEIKPLVSDRKQNPNEQINSAKNSGIHDVQFLSPSNRQFTFDQNDVRSSGFGSVRYGNDSLLKSNQNLGIPQTNNQQIFTTNTDSKYNYSNTASKNPTNKIFDTDDKVKRAQSNQFQNSSISPLYSSSIQQTNQVTKQTFGNFSLPPLLPPSARSQQYDEIVSKYLPKQTSQQNLLLQQQSGVISVLGQSLTNSIGSIQMGGYGMNQSIDSRISHRERSNSNQKIATASELLQNFSTKKNEVYSPQPRQPYGLLQNNLVQSSLSERLNTINSAQTLKGMKDSNTFQNFSVNPFDINTNKPYIPTSLTTFEMKKLDEIPQYTPLLLNKNQANTEIKSVSPLNNFPQSSDFKAQTPSLQYLNAINLDNQQKTSYQTNYGYQFDKNTFAQTSDLKNFSKSTYNFDINGINTTSQIPIPSVSNIQNNPTLTSASQFIRSNNHMQQMNSIQNPTNSLDQQLARKFSGHNEISKSYQPIADINIFQRRQSYDQQPILDSKSLLQFRDQPTSQNQQFQIQQQPQQNFQQIISQPYNSEKQFIVPPTLSPISTPRRNRILSNNQNQFANDLDLEFQEFLMNLQTRKPSENIEKQEEVKRALQQSKSQPFLPLANIAPIKSNLEQPEINQEPFKNIDKIQQNPRTIGEKPKRKIFEENSQLPQGQKNATMKMNQQMLKNVLNFNKNNQQDQQVTFQKGQAEQQIQQKQTFSEREIQFEQQPKKSESTSDKDYNLSSQIKYFVPPKDETLLNKYFNKSSSQPYLLKENTPSLTQDNSDISPLDQRTTNRITYRDTNNQNDNKNTCNKKSLNIFEFKAHIDQPIQRKSEFRFDANSNNRVSELNNIDRNSSRTAFGQKESIKDQIRTIQTDDEDFEEKVKQQKMSKSKNNLKIFSTSHISSSSGLQTIQSPKILDSQRTNLPQPQKTFSQTSQQQQSNQNITDNDRKTLQIVEQKLKNNNQDNTSKVIPILCIDCDNFYEQKDIENHICIPSIKQTSTSLNNKQSQIENIKPNNIAYPQNNLSEEQYNFELSLINDKISIIQKKTNEQPYSDEKVQIQKILTQVLNNKTTYEELTQECRNLNQINKTVENMKSRNSISLLILSQRAELLIKDKIDLNKKRLCPQQGQRSSVNIDIIPPTQTPKTSIQVTSNRNYQAQQKNNNNFTQYNESNYNNKNNNKEFEQKDTIDMQFNYNNRDERTQIERMTVNTRNQINQVQNNKIFSNNTPSLQSIPAQNLDNPSSQGTIYSHTKNPAIMSNPVQKIFSNNNTNEIGRNTVNNQNMNYQPQYNQQNESQYYSSMASLESKDLLKQQSKSDNNIKQNDSQQANNKRNFYNIALNLKLKLSPNHPARDCIISEMFNQAEKQNVSENNFQNFIENYFKQFN